MEFFVRAQVHPCSELLGEKFREDGSTQRMAIKKILENRRSMFYNDAQFHEKIHLVTLLAAKLTVQFVSSFVCNRNLPSNFEKIKKR